jgi:iron complex transport system ATP-binding protein
VNDVSMTIPEGKISILIGANGSGKSTLLKTMVRLIRPYSGVVTMDDKPLHQVAQKKLARQIAVLPQSPIVPEGITVGDLVGRGRFPYQSFLKSWSKEDSGAVAEALERMGIQDLANRCVDELSGGQRQRVAIARALVNKPAILLADEPTGNLDSTSSEEIMAIFQQLNDDGATIIMVTHEPDIAQHTKRIITFRDGQIKSNEPVINPTIARRGN